MMLSIEKRGRHATGIAVDGGEESLIWKSATTVSTVLKSEPWNKIMDDINTSDTIILGHTRQAVASLNNSGLDEAAHPFKFGEIVGAHNGMIFNWRDLEKELKPEKPFIVDSEAIFALLDVAKKPVPALEKLEGYFALEWIRRKQIYLARSASGQLAAAYVYPQRTLYWHSEGDVLKRILIKAGLVEQNQNGTGDFKIWSINPNCVYRYDPKKFTITSANAEKYTGDFSVTARKSANKPGRQQLTFPLHQETLEAVRNQSSAYVPSGEYEPAYIRRLRVRVETLERQMDSIFSFLESKGLLDEYDAEEDDEDDEAILCEYCNGSIKPDQRMVDGTNGGKIHAYHIRSTESLKNA